MKNVLIAFALYLLCVTSVSAGDQNKVVFTDGSMLNAEVVSLENGVYTLRSGSLGEITVPAEQISSIAALNAPNTSAPATSQLPSGDQLNSQINAYAGKIMSDPKLMESMNALMSDPQVMRILSDPSVANAVNSGDMQGLMNNPKVMELLNNPNINSMINQMHK